MKPEDTLAEIQRKLESLTAWTAASLRALRREYSRILADWEPASVLRLALLLVGKDRPAFPRRFMAYELLAHHRPALARLRSRDVEALGAGLDSWAAVDTFACYVSGPVWREQQISDGVVQRWAGSSDRWWRRAALVSTVPLNCKARGGAGDAERTLAICDLLLDDRDDMVVKAMSWALRELGKRDASVVSKYVRDNSTRLAPRAFREVRNKLRTGVKNPRNQR
jgi:3-methyladenine DNA glycosylase AlkD